MLGSQPDTGVGGVREKKLRVRLNGGFCSQMAT